MARALVDSPECVLLDEPLSALDPHLRAETAELLESIQAKLGTTFLFITHDREEALRLGRRIGVLNRGRLEQLGPPEELYRQPRTPFVASFLGKINWMSGHWLSATPGAITIANQSVPIAHQNGFASGPIKVGVRPEDLQIAQSGFLPAKVVRRQFLGDSMIVRLLLGDGTPLVVDQRLPLTDGAAGDEVRVGWQPEAAHLFPPEPSEADHEPSA